MLQANMDSGVQRDAAVETPNQDVRADEAGVDEAVSQVVAIMH